MIKLLSKTVLLFLLLAVVPVVDAQQDRNQLPQKEHRISNAPFLNPAEAVSKMGVPEGFKVSVFAAEPDIAEPIAFCFDDRGRLWVAENFNYQTRGKHKQNQQISRIQILEDTDGDGVFDKKKTFTDKLTFTSGLACGFGGVFVGSPPNLSFIPDRDGDDKPDGPPEVLLDGWGFHDRHETLNSFIWGPDGWLYGCHGVFTRSNVGRPGSSEEDRQFIDGGIWRYHPVQRRFEVHARGLSNPWGFDFDDHGQGFATCCVIPHLFHVFQGGVYHKQSLPHVNPHIYDDIKTIRDHEHLSAHGGARFYLADAFPDRFRRNHLFMCNIHEHAVLTDFMEPRGSSFVGKHGEDFLPTNDLAWVGFSVEIGPEGGVYVLDWHDTDICGNSVNFPNSGRVYRIVPDGAKPIAPPNLRDMSNVELAELQLHENDWYVRQARTLLQSRAADGDDLLDAQEVLSRIFDAAELSRKRLRAMWALYVTGAIDEEGLVSFLDHPDEHVRGWAARFLGDQSPFSGFHDASKFEKASLSDTAIQKLESLSNSDPSPVVRRFISSAVQRLPFKSRWTILEGLASRVEDVQDPNLPRMIWFGLEPMVPKNPERSIELAVGSKMPQLAEFVARRLTSESGAVVRGRPARPAKAESRNWQRELQKVAPGFRVSDVGEGGVVFHKVFRNAKAVQTHPRDKDYPSFLSRRPKIAKGVRTKLKLRVSHHPHGDWQLRVFANGDLLLDRVVGSKSVGGDEWLDVAVDLSQYAGETVSLRIENKANNWANEWAYWNRVSIDTEPETKIDTAPSVKPAKVVFISGHPSHGRMYHEHRAGNLILAKALNESGLNVDAKLVPHYGYPEDETVFDEVSTVVIFSTGHSGHVLKGHLDEFNTLMDQGVGVVMIHWSTEAEKGKMGDLFLKWMGGFCDLDWSVNPHWKPEFKSLPDHPVCKGVKPFSVDDEWYYHMRFVEDLEGVTPILTDVPPAHTLRRPDGPRSGNTTVRKAVANGETQHVAWAYQRPEGGRGFGFTGAHNHESWQDENFRKIVLNAILWTAQVEVPETGCPTDAVDDQQIKQNIDRQ